MRLEARTTSMSSSIFHVVTAVALGALSGACGLLNGLSGECDTCLVPDPIACTQTEECRALEFAVACTTDRDCASSEVCATVNESTYCVEPADDDAPCETALTVTSVDDEEVSVCLDDFAGVCDENGFCIY
jgi:hypothetical protein